MNPNDSLLNVIKITPLQMEKEFERILLKNGFNQDKAHACSRIFTENSLDGIYTHGVNRFARFIEYVAMNLIVANSEPELKYSYSSVEQWDGKFGPGPLNAFRCTERAMEIADKFGIGCVALSNSNHWMRAGYYGWKAAKEGYAFIGWTNTIALMPAWGAMDSHLGNNPIVFAVPYKDEAIVLDMAMSQFSFGIMEMYQSKGQKLPLPGGYNKNGDLTSDPSEILESLRSLPIGYWKGAGMALMLDLLATILSGGLSTFQVTQQNNEQGVSQVYIAIALNRLDNSLLIPRTVRNIIHDLLTSAPVSEQTEILYPGKRVLETRKENLKNGIPVNKNIWQEIINL
jgi:3-dehydro-L-gulonate 2-dehydrogenase